MEDEFHGRLINRNSRGGQGKTKSKRVYIQKVTFRNGNQYKNLFKRVRKPQKTSRNTRWIQLTG